MSAWWTWIPVGMNLAGCAVNVTMAFRGHRRAVRCMDESFAIAHSMVPAVAVCKTLAEDPNLPEPLRAFARSGLPVNAGITIESVSVSERVH